MRAVLLGLVLLQVQAASDPPVAKPQYMRYMRSLSVPSGSGEACAVLDAQIFPHASPSLTDLRIFPQNAGAHEVPYAITLSQAVTQDTQAARVLNLGTEHGRITFDLQMPPRAYTAVNLQLDPAVHDFLATATVTGEGAPAARTATRELGSFTLFDLQSQHLSRDTTLPLAESTFPYLHVSLSLTAAPGSHASAPFAPQIVEGAEVPPSREAQVLYTTVAETSSVSTSGRESVATFSVPPRVPIERVEFVLPPNFNGNFSRDVKVSATAQPAPPAGSRGGSVESGLENDQRAALPELVNGSILRVHTTQAGREIRTDQLGFPALLGSNLQRPATVQVAIQNGDDEPLPIASVRLQMRQRRLCFDASAAAPLALYYGDSALLAPVYEYDRLFTASETPLRATLGPEQLNPAYTPRPETQRSFLDLHPEVLWIALIAVICVLGAIAIRTAKKLGR